MLQSVSMYNRLYSKRNMIMGPYAGVDYKLTLCPLQHIYHGQPYARVDLNPMPESTLSASQVQSICPLKKKSL